MSKFVGGGHLEHPVKHSCSETGVDLVSGEEESGFSVISCQSEEVLWVLLAVGFGDGGWE